MQRQGWPGPSLCLQACFPPGVFPNQPIDSPTCRHSLDELEASFHDKFAPSKMLTCPPAHFLVYSFLCRHSLDELESLVRDKFAAVADTGISPPAFPPDAVTHAQVRCAASVGCVQPKHAAAMGAVSKLLPLGALAHLRAGGAQQERASCGGRQHTCRGLWHGAPCCLQAAFQRTAAMPREHHPLQDGTLICLAPQRWRSSCLPGLTQATSFPDGPPQGSTLIRMMPRQWRSSCL